MNSNLAAARATMLDADQAIRHGAIFGPLQYDRFNDAAATVDRIASYPARARETRKRHMAGDHARPQIGSCPVCLDNYVRGI